MSRSGDGFSEANSTLEEILREGDAVISRIRAKMEMAAERRKAVERLAKLRQ